jgi:pimeloyl-ACP methyl ester carboxylesterase
MPSFHSIRPERLRVNARPWEEPSCTELLAGSSLSVLRGVIVLLALTAAGSLAANTGQVSAPLAQIPGGTGFTIFVRGTPIGTEQIAVSRSADGWTITSAGRVGAPLDVVSRRLQVRYTADWRPAEFTFDGTVRGQTQSVHTIVDGTTARSDIVIAGETKQKNDTVADDTLLVLPNTFFGPYEALAARLRTAPPGSTIKVYGVPQINFSILVGDSAPEQFQTTARLVGTRRTHIILDLPGAKVDGDIWSDESGRLVRLSLPGQSVDVVREDVAAVSSRSVPVSRSNDEQVHIPANGFSLAGTVSKPSESATTSAAVTVRHPAVILVGGSGPADRDSMVFGIPILGQIANALADAGFVVLRYDKRGIGQSGGRAESASLADFADDVRSTVKMLSERRDVDPKRIAVVGHSEGGAVALIAATKEKRIGAVGLIAANGVSGADLVLAQQQHLLNRSTFSPEEKQAKIELQKRIHEAVLTGKGWEQLPPELRKQVDNPEFQSILQNDPARIMPDVRQPVFILHGELDTQVEPSNADRLEALARKRKNAPPVDVVKIPGVNHLLVPATTGEMDEYGKLRDKHVSAGVTDALAAWLEKTLSTRAGR